MTTYDAVVVGAGPTGLACGIELQKRGMTVVMIEKGCVVNSIYHYPTNMTWFTTPELLEIGNLPMTSLNDKPGRIEALKYYRRVADHYKLDVRQYEQVSQVDGEDGAFTVHTRDKRGCAQMYGARKVILATGFYDVPNRLNVPGEDLDKVIHYYKEAHPYFDQDIVIVGGKNSAAIAALELFWTGARVTLVHRKKTLSDRIKYWIRPNIDNRIKSGEVKAYFESSLREIRLDSVLIDTPSGTMEIPNDFVFAMIGYQPDLPFLAANGVTIQEATGKPYTDPDTLESQRKGVFLAGVIVAGMHTNEIFIENGRFHGKQIAEAIERQLSDARQLSPAV